MISKTIYFPYYYMISRHLTLSDFGLKIDGKIPNEKNLRQKNERRKCNFCYKTKIFRH